MWCDEHWDHIHRKVKDSEVAGYIASSPEAAVKCLKEGRYDPLVVLWILINDLFKQCEYSTEENDSGCPLCVLKKVKRKDLINIWVDGCLHDAIAYKTNDALFIPETNTILTDQNKSYARR